MSAAHKRIHSVLKLHYPNHLTGRCNECDRPLPCPTTQAARGQLVYNWQTRRHEPAQGQDQ